jgi:hypothetical protein
MYLNDKIVECSDGVYVKYSNNQNSALEVTIYKYSDYLKFNVGDQGLYNRINTKIYVYKITFSSEFGYMNIYYNESNDNCLSDLVYTDPLFKKEIRLYLNTLFKTNLFDSLQYTEKGMQSNSHINMEFDSNFKNILNLIDKKLHINSIKNPLSFLISACTLNEKDIYDLIYLNLN